MSRLEWFGRYWLPVLAYVSVIGIVSAQPRLTVRLPIPNGDKVAHLAEYFGLGLLLARALGHSLSRRRMLTPALLAAAIGISIGAADEVFQRAIAGRDSSVLDLAADTMGVLFAQIAYLLARRD